MKLSELTIRSTGGQGQNFGGWAVIDDDSGRRLATITLTHEQCASILREAKWELGKISISLSYQDFMGLVATPSGVVPPSVVPAIPDPDDDIPF